MKKDYAASEGEEIIKEFLEENNIKFEREAKIKNLKYDYTAYRVADFYLPQYKVYIEFLGQWNHPEHKSRYKQKMTVYHKNNIPCVYFYPDNLGILNFVFRSRLKGTLKKHRLTFQLFRYNMHLWFEDSLGFILIIGALIYFIEDIKSRIVFSLIFLHLLYKSIKSTFLK